MDTSSQIPPQLLDSTNVSPIFPPNLTASEHLLSDIEKNLNERLAQLGLQIPSIKSSSTRYTQQLSPSLNREDGSTQILSFKELRTALSRQIQIAEIKDQIIDKLSKWTSPTHIEESNFSEFEIQIAILLLPYCIEFIPNFQNNISAAELAMDLDFESILNPLVQLDLSQNSSQEQIETCAANIIHSFLQHPLIPQQEIPQIEAELHTTMLKDKNGTAVYTASDAKFLKLFLEDQKILSRNDEIGLLAMLISGYKWNKIDSEVLFLAAIEYTLEVLSKKYDIMVLHTSRRGHDFPIACVLGEYVAQNTHLSLEKQISFIEEFLLKVKELLQKDKEQFVEEVKQNYLPKLKEIFHNFSHSCIYRFSQTFEREFLKLNSSFQNKLLLIKKINNIYELAFYSFEAICNLNSATSEVYALEKLSEGTEHFSLRNNIPLSDGMDFFNRKNTLAEILLSAIKYRKEQFKLKTLPDNEKEKITGVLISDLLFCIDQLRYLFEHGYANGQENGYNHYLEWKDRLLSWSENYYKLLSGRSSSDVENYRIKNLANNEIEKHLAFVNMHIPSVFLEGNSELHLETSPLTRRPEDIIKGNFLHFLKNFHSRSTEINQKRYDQQLLSYETAQNERPTIFTTKDLQKRAFLSRSDLPLSFYTFEILLSFITSDASDQVSVFKAIEIGLEVVQKAYIAEQIQASKIFLNQLDQRLKLLVFLKEKDLNNFQKRINSLIQDLKTREPIKFASYLVALKEQNEFELSDERILEEWKNIETSIQRIFQIVIVLFLTRDRKKILRIVETFTNWIKLTQLTPDSIKHAALNNQIKLIKNISLKNPITFKILRVFLKMAFQLQLFKRISDLNPPETYIIEDLLTIETPISRIQELEIILFLYPISKRNNLLEKFETIILEQSSPAFFALEDTQILEERLKQLKKLQRYSRLQRFRYYISHNFFYYFTRFFSRNHSTKKNIGLSTNIS